MIIYIIYLIHCNTNSTLPVKAGFELSVKAADCQIDYILLVGWGC